MGEGAGDSQQQWAQHTCLVIPILFEELVLHEFQLATSLLSLHLELRQTAASPSASQRALTVRRTVPHRHLL